MIHRIELENFKGHQYTTVPLGRMTALVGPNSSGKTSVLQALHFLGQLRQKEDTDIFLNENEPRFLVRNAQDGFSLRLQGSQDGQGSPEPVPWTFLTNVKIQKHPSSRWDSHYNWSVSEAEGESRNWRDSLQNKNVPEPLLRAPPFPPFAEYLKLDGRRLASASFLSETTPRIQFDGWGLPTLISHFKTYEDEAFAKLEEAVRKVVPQVQRIRVRKSVLQIHETKMFTVDKMSVPYQDTRNVPGDELILDMVEAKEIPAHAVSEGTLLAIGLLAVLFDPHCPELVLLDDVEKGLHPKAQRELVQVLKALSDTHDKLQIVMTTHSPYIVDELAPSSVCVMAADKQGKIVACKLDQHPRAHQALEVLTTGEFLSAEGEEWVLGFSMDLSPKMRKKPKSLPI